jgi:hypothetical protein
MIAGAALLSVAASQAPSLTDIQMHLFYEESGRLSPDLTQQPDFAGWNTIIGEGSAEEPANDLLIVVELKTTGEKFVRTPLRVSVTAKGKTLASRQYRTFLIPKAGRVYLPLWVRDAGCAGDIKADVRFGSQHRSESLSLQCGE